MSSILEPRPMTRRPGRPKRSQRNDVAVKVDSGVVRKAKFVADARGITLAEYVSELLRSPVDRDFDKAVAAIGRPEK